MQQQSGNWVQCGTIGDVRTSVGQHSDHPIGDGSSFARQMVGEAVRGVDKRREHDGLFGQFGGAKDLKKN